ncbi:MAG: hypothetical protein IT569_03960 [Leptospiraceae bacterium]|nr:hypothetical protein [Leptospiraceae bacterium]
MTEILKSTVTNLDDIISNMNINWQSGFRGIIQLFTILMVSYKLKDENAE